MDQDFIIPQLVDNSCTFSLSVLLDASKTTRALVRAHSYTTVAE